jgi:hypothetical protein
VETQVASSLTYMTLTYTQKDTIQDNFYHGTSQEQIQLPHAHPMYATNIASGYVHLLLKSPLGMACKSTLQIYLK